MNGRIGSNHPLICSLKKIRSPANPNAGISNNSDVFTSYTRDWQPRHLNEKGIFAS